MPLFTVFKVEQWFSEIAKDDREAFEFLKAFYFWVHKQDDLHDRDKPVFLEGSVLTDLSFIQALTSNEFYRKHSAFLWPIILTSALAYIASEEMRTAETVIDRITAQVLKSEYGNVMFATAYLVGGQVHALAMSRKYRAYAFDDEKTKNPPSV